MSIMKQWFAITGFCVILCTGFLLEKSCKTDADCPANRCCRPLGHPSFRPEKVEDLIFICHIHRDTGNENRTCHLNSTEIASCGCGKGLVCSPYTPEEGELYYGTPMFNESIFINRYGICTQP